MIPENSTTYEAGFQNQVLFILVLVTGTTLFLAWLATSIAVRITKNISILDIKLIFTQKLQKVLQYSTEYLKYIENAFLLLQKKWIQNRYRSNGFSRRMTAAVEEDGLLEEDDDEDEEESSMDENMENESKENEKIEIQKENIPKNSTKKGITTIYSRAYYESHFLNHQKDGNYSTVSVYLTLPNGTTLSYTPRYPWYWDGVDLFTGITPNKPKEYDNNYLAPNYVSKYKKEEVLKKCTRRYKRSTRKMVTKRDSYKKKGFQFLLNWFNSSSTSTPSNKVVKASSQEHVFVSKLDQKKLQKDDKKRNVNKSLSEEEKKQTTLLLTKSHSEKKLIEDKVINQSNMNNTTEKSSQENSMMTTPPPQNNNSEKELQGNVEIAIEEEEMKNKNKESSLSSLLSSSTISYDPPFLNECWGKKGSSTHHTKKNNRKFYDLSYSKISNQRKSTSSLIPPTNDIIHPITNSTNTQSFEKNTSSNKILLLSIPQPLYTNINEMNNFNLSTTPIPTYNSNTTINTKTKITTTSTSTFNPLNTQSSTNKEVVVVNKNGLNKEREEGKVNKPSPKDDTQIPKKTKEQNINQNDDIQMKPTITTSMTKDKSNKNKKSTKINPKSKSKSDLNLDSKKVKIIYPTIPVNPNLTFVPLYKRDEMDQSSNLKSKVSHEDMEIIYKKLKSKLEKNKTKQIK